MKLLPYSFKRIGLVLSPVGFALWTFFQSPAFRYVLDALFEDARMGAARHATFVCSLVVSFFSFLIGLYFIAFSKEKVEDEMIRQLRLESFQFAAAMQLVVTIIGLAAMAILGEPEEEGMMMFFIGVVLSFWLCFIGRFHSTLRRLK